MKIKQIFIWIVLVLSVNFSQAQAPSRTTIKGILQDTLVEAVPFATVMLLSPADSALVNFTTSNDKGEFTFNNVKNSRYLLKASHVSFLPLQQMIEPSLTDINNLKVVEMKPLINLIT